MIYTLYLIRLPDFLFSSSPIFDQNRIRNISFLTTPPAFLYSHASTVHPLVQGFRGKLSWWSGGAGRFHLKIGFVWRSLLDPFSFRYWKWAVDRIPDWFSIYLVAQHWWFWRFRVAIQEQFAFSSGVSSEDPVFRLWLWAFSFLKKAVLKTNVILWVFLKDSGDLASLASILLYHFYNHWAFHWIHSSYLWCLYSLLRSLLITFCINCRYQAELCPFWRDGDLHRVQDVLAWRRRRSPGDGQRKRYSDFPQKREPRWW